MRVSDTSWEQISTDLQMEFAFPGDTRKHGVAWLYAAVYRTRDEKTQKIIEFGNPDGRIVGQRTWATVVYARRSLGLDVTVDIKQSGQPTICRLAKSQVGDVIIVEWEMYHPAHVNPEIYIERLIARFRQVSEQNTEW